MEDLPFEKSHMYYKIPTFCYNYGHEDYLVFADFFFNIFEIWNLEFGNQLAHSTYRIRKWLNSVHGSNYLSLKLDYEMLND